MLAGKSPNREAAIFKINTNVLELTDNLTVNKNRHTFTVLVTGSESEPIASVKPSCLLQKREHLPPSLLFSEQHFVMSQGNPASTAAVRRMSRASLGRGAMGCGTTKERRPRSVAIDSGTIAEIRGRFHRT